MSGAERQARNKADEQWNVRVPREGGRANADGRVPQDRPPRWTKRRGCRSSVRFPAGVNIPETRMGAHLRSVEIVGPFAPGGAGRVAQPPAHLRLPAGVCRPPNPACAKTDPRHACAPRLPAARRRAPTSSRCWRMYKEGRTARGFDGRHRACAGRVPAGQPGVPVPRRSATRRTRRRAASTASATWSSPPGSRSSCGAASPMTSCSTWRAKGRLGTPQCSISRSSG